MIQVLNLIIIQLILQIIFFKLKNNTHYFIIYRELTENT